MTKQQRFSFFVAIFGAFSRVFRVLNDGVGLSTVKMFSSSPSARI
jgi:hypothetical protein